jgi:hypothetical protein
MQHFFPIYKQAKNKRDTSVICFFSALCCAFFVFFVKYLPLICSVFLYTSICAPAPQFFVTYNGAGLDVNMKELVTNALQYYLQLREVETTESY